MKSQTVLKKSYLTCHFLNVIFLYAKPHLLGSHIGKRFGNSVVAGGSLIKRGQAASWKSDGRGRKTYLHCCEVEGS
jgi:hypothetical protein